MFIDLFCWRVQAVKLYFGFLLGTRWTSYIQGKLLAKDICLWFLFLITSKGFCFFFCFCFVFHWSLLFKRDNFTNFLVASRQRRRAWSLHKRVITDTLRWYLHSSPQHADCSDSTTSFYSLYHFHYCAYICQRVERSASSLRHPMVGIAWGVRFHFVTPRRSCLSSVSRSICGEAWPRSFRSKSMPFQVLYSAP